jgi:hypothetical protein
MNGTSATAWVANKIAKHDNVKSVEVVGGKIQVCREKGEDVTIAAMSARRVDARAVQAVLSQVGDVDFVTNIPKDAYILGDTYQLASECNFGFGGFGELLSALNLPSPRAYISSEFGFVLRSLQQHDKVRNVTRLDDRRLLIDREGLEPVVVLVLNDYELAAEQVRAGIERYGEFQAIVRSNPNSRVTGAATSAADDARVRIFSWRELMGELNRKWNWKR